MDKIESFKIDHRKLEPGVYISRVDGDITTYDIRMRKPNTGDLLENAAIHSFEHLFATLIRNSKLAGQIIYFGPMGCQTGFYLLVRNADHKIVLELVKQTLLDCIGFCGEMPGASEIECGNYRNLDLCLAQDESQRYYETIKEIKVKDLNYKD